MPVFGELDVATVAPRLPRMHDLDTEAWELPKAEIVQLSFEVGDETSALLPRSMHPAIPPYASIIVARYPESPVGPFALAQLRLVGRAGAHPRGLVLGAIASTPAAAAALRKRWGFPAETGTVMLRRSHDRIDVAARLGGETILDASLVAPEQISGGDVQYIQAVTLATVGDAAPCLVQVEAHYTFHRAERGRPVVSRLDVRAWNAAPLRLLFPIAATVTSCDTDLPRIRFTMEAEIPVVRGTRRIR